jgi:TonB family protein
MGSWSWIDLVVFVLCTGVAVRWLWLALGLFRLRRYRANAERLSPVPSVIARLQTRLGVQPEFYLSSELASPLTFGIRPAVVLLPTRFTGMPEETQEAIVCHELCHVRRRDWLVTFAEETVRGLLWFHPFVAWLVREMQLAREQVVDRQVVEITGSRQAYVAALIEIASARVHPAIAMAPLFLGKRQITRRVEVLMKEVSMSRVRLVLSVVAMLLILAATGQFSAWAFPPQGAGQAREETVYRVGDGVTAPKLISKAEPEYTEEARRAKIEGMVVLHVAIQPDGRAHNVRVTRSLDAGLDQKAMEAIEKWTFQPGQKDGKPVAVAATIEVNFRLLDDPKSK